MATYYEILSLAPTASSAEIETAWDEKYNQWRRLVNHHDPQIQLQAQQALQTLEKVRETLGDPSRRAAYDAGIGVGGPIGGLADPSALLQAVQAGPVAPPPPPPSPRGNGPAPPIQRGAPGLWACPKCQAENPPSTKFCFKCGTQLVRLCPECKGETSLIATGMCGNCGYKYDVATRREELRQQNVGLEKQASQFQPGLAEATVNAQKIGGIVWGWIGIVCGFFTFIGGFSPNGGWAIVTGLIILVIAGIGLANGYSYKNQWKAKAANLKAVIAKVEEQARRNAAEHDSLQRNRG